MARQDKSKPGRVTPKGTTPGSVGSRGPSAATTSAPSGTTPANRTPVSVGQSSSPIVPVVMFGSLILGVLIIVLNYVTEDVLGTPSNAYLFGGLALVLVGIGAATRFK